MKKYKHTMTMILLIVAAIIGGYGFARFMIEHIFLAPLMFFCIVGVLAIEKEV